MIQVVLEFVMDSILFGVIWVVVLEDVYFFDGICILILCGV